MARVAGFLRFAQRFGDANAKSNERSFDESDLSITNFASWITEVMLSPSLEGKP
jgi:hypothetical protein